MSKINVVVKDLPADLDGADFCERLKELLKRGGILTRGCVTMPDEDVFRADENLTTIQVDAHGYPGAALISTYVGRCLTEITNQTYELTAHLAD